MSLVIVSSSERSMIIGGVGGGNDADVGISYTCSICRRVHGWARCSRCSSQYERQQGAASASSCFQSLMTFVPLRPGWPCTQTGSPQFVCSHLWLVASDPDSFFIFLGVSRVEQLQANEVLGERNLPGCVLQREL